jgi:hypothetical protein
MSFRWVGAGVEYTFPGLGVLVEKKMIFFKKKLLTGGYTPIIFVGMPSQRKKGKKQVAVWLTVAERHALESLSRFSGKTKTEILKDKINDYLKKNTEEK